MDTAKRLELVSKSVDALRGRGLWFSTPELDETSCVIKIEAEIWEDRHRAGLSTCVTCRSLDCARDPQVIVDYLLHEMLAKLDAELAKKCRRPGAANNAI